jgi:tetratricopeptide (TPR) repeat protein
MYYNQKGDTLCPVDQRGFALITPQARPWFEKAVATLERGVQVDRTFNEVNRRRQLARGDRLDRIYDAGLTPVYQALGTAYQRLGRYREAFNAFNYQRQLEPESPEPYLRLALMHIEQGQLEDAAIDLIQTLLLDWKRTDAWNLLANLYSSAGPAARTAITMSPTGPRLNVDNPVVRDHFIQAYRGFIRIFRFANRPEAAEAARRIAIFKYGMPPSLFDSVMIEPLQHVTPDGSEPIEPKPARK